MTTDTTESFDWRIELSKALPVLRAYARSLTRNASDADDLVQDTVVRAWSHREQFQIGTNLHAWLMTILRNAFYTKCRRKRWEVEDIDGEYAGALTVEPNQEWNISLQELDRALQKLPDEQREVIALVIGAGMNYEQAAEICGCALGTIKSRLARARMQLTEMLEREPRRTSRARDRTQHEDRVSF